ncbi:MAG: hypothetical protein Fur0027_07320 [Raineya sp.]
MPYDCVTLGNYIELDCLADKFSYNKVVAIGIIKNPTKDFGLPATYTYADKAALEADIEVLNKVVGEYDGSETEVAEAYGAKLEQIVSRKHKATFEVEYNAKNWDFFNRLAFARNYGIVLISGNMQELAYSGRVNVTFVVKTPITRELDKVRNFVVEASWSNMDLLKPVAVPTEQIELFS